MDYVYLTIKCSNFKAKIIIKYLMDNGLKFSFEKIGNYSVIRLFFHKNSLIRVFFPLTDFLKTKRVKFIGSASDNTYTNICNY